MESNLVPGINRVYTDLRTSLKDTAEGLTLFLLGSSVEVGILAVQ